MANENDGVGLQPIPEFDSFITKDESTGNVTTNWEEVARTLHGSARQYEGLSKRNYSDLEKLKKDPRLTKPLENDAKPNQQQPPKPEEKTEFDYGELAFLTAKGVSDEDTDFLLQEVKSTGKPLKELLGYNYVKEELKNRAEARATQTATPSGSKRTGPGASNTVDYWIGKIEAGKATVADIPDRELRTKVVNARMKVQKDQSQFTDQPVV